MWRGYRRHRKRRLVEENRELEWELNRGVVLYDARNRKAKKKRRFK